jgi:hypothetical protein
MDLVIRGGTSETGSTFWVDIFKAGVAGVLLKSHSCLSFARCIIVL